MYSNARKKRIRISGNLRMNMAAMQLILEKITIRFLFYAEQVEGQSNLIGDRSLKNKKCGTKKL